MTETDDNGMLSRWSRRKFAARKAETDTQLADKTQVSSLPPVAQDEETSREAAAAREAELTANRDAAEAVDLENVTKATDFRIFMKEGVPAALRKKALAVLWRSNPVLANIDGLNEYDDDYTDANLVPKLFKSAWEAGRGYKKEIKAEPPANDEKTSEPVTAAQSEGGEDTAGEDAGAETDSVAIGPDRQDPPPPALSHEPVLRHAEQTAIEPDSTPRVSLRRRLNFDESA